MKDHSVWVDDYIKKERIKRETEEAEMMHNLKPSDCWDPR